MSGLAITKVELTPQTVYCKSTFKIAICVYPITNGAGDRKLPTRLSGTEESAIAQEIGKEI